MVDTRTGIINIIFRNSIGKKLRFFFFATVLIILNSVCINVFEQVFCNRNITTKSGISKALFRAYSHNSFIVKGYSHER